MFFLDSDMSYIYIYIYMGVMPLQDTNLHYSTGTTVNAIGFERENSCRSGLPCAVLYQGTW